MKYKLEEVKEQSEYCLNCIHNLYFSQERVQMKNFREAKNSRNSFLNHRLACPYCIEAYERLLYCNPKERNAQADSPCMAILPFFINGYFPFRRYTHPLKRPWSLISADNSF